MQKEGIIIKRIAYTDGLRVCAAYMVILIHVAALYWATTPIDSIEWKTYNFYDSLARPAVPIFVMITGYFLLDPQRSISIRDVFSKYCKRIFVIWLVWSVFYATCHSVFWNMLRHRDIPWDMVVQSFFAGHYHLWYCKMLLCLYLLLPFLRKIAEDKRLTEYFLLLALWFTVLWPILPVRELQLLRENTFFSFTSGFVGYFLLGYYLKQQTLTRPVRYGIYTAGLLGFAWTVVASQQKSILLNTAFGYYDPWLPNIVLMTAAVFVFFQYAANRYLEQCSTVLHTMSKYTMGVYLVHPFVMAVLERLGFTILSYPVYLSIPVYTLAVFCISYLCSYVMKKLPWVGTHLC